jgi:hypothetical protein
MLSTGVDVDGSVDCPFKPESVTECAIDPYTCSVNVSSRCGRRNYNERFILCIRSQAIVKQC